MLIVNIIKHILKRSDILRVMFSLPGGDAGLIIGRYFGGRQNGSKY